MASSFSSKCPDPCSICLEPGKQEAYLDRCFHSFCYPCIVHWIKVLSSKQHQELSSIKCPLCKGENSSIIHGFNGEHFLQHYLRQGDVKSSLSSAHDFRVQWYSSDPRLPNRMNNVLKYWKSRGYLRRNMWLESWLRREVQALTQEEDVDVIVHHILGVIETFLRLQQQQQKGRKDEMSEEKRHEFRRLLFDAARHFLLGRTERFVDEVELFLALGLTIEAYDQICLQNFTGTSSTTAE